MGGAGQNAIPPDTMGAIGPLHYLVVVNEAIDFLRHHRDPQKPFLLNVCTHETHQPIEADPWFQSLYPNVDESHRQFYGDATQMDALNRPDCNDDNVCTDDSCEPPIGCIHPANAAP